jgi:hypothetical protein
VSLDYCSYDHQYFYMRQGAHELPSMDLLARPLAAMASTPPTNSMVATFAAEVEVEGVPQVPTQRAPELEVPADAPRRVAPWRRIGRLRMRGKR